MSIEQTISTLQEIDRLAKHAQKKLGAPDLPYYSMWFNSMVAEAFVYARSMCNGSTAYFSEIDVAICMYEAARWNNSILIDLTAGADVAGQEQYMDEFAHEIFEDLLTWLWSLDGVDGSL